VLIRESTEGLFASMGKGVVTDTEARETLVITRKTSERLFEFSFRLAERRKARVVEALPVPEQTIETLKEDKEWLKSPKLSGRR